MNLTLCGGLPYHDRKGRPIYPDFRNMLRLEEILEDADLSNAEATIAGLSLLYGEIPSDIKGAVDELQWFYFCGDLPSAGRRGKGSRIYDFREDAPYLFSAFLSAYGINLLQESMHLHWWAFMALFVSLPENTQMMRIMCDRNMDTSKLKGETKRYYEERKKAVALKPKRFSSERMTLEERRQARQNRLDELYAEAERAKKEQKGGNHNGI